MLPKLKMKLFSSGEIFSILEHRISISGACSWYKNQFFLNRSRFLIPRAHDFHFGSMLLKKKNISFNFQKKFPFQEQALQIWEHEFACLPACLPASQSIDPSICLSMCLSIDPSIQPSIHPSIHLSVGLSVCRSIYIGEGS